MTVPAALVLGILIGWLIEWVIDWWFWRRKRVVPTETVRTNTAVSTDQGDHVQALLAENAALKARLDIMAAAPDDLKVIKGIGPEIERRLHAAGIKTFAQLGDLTPADLERILGDVIRRLSNEDDLLAQARELARKGK